MHYFNQSLKLALVTGTSLFGCLVAGELPAKAATFADSDAFLRLDEFSILPQNPDANSNRDAIVLTGDDPDSVVDANGDGTLEFVINDDDAFIDLDFTSDASGEGTEYFGLGVADSFATSTFFVDSDETLSFDFDLSLALESFVDDPSEGSINNFSGVSFALFDDVSNTFLGEFLASGNLDTNLAGGIDNDNIGATSNLNFTIDSLSELQPISGNTESASLDITGSIAQTFAVPTQVRLEATTFNRSCVQAPVTGSPCTVPPNLANLANDEVAVPEPSSIVSLIAGFLGLGVFYAKRGKKFS